MPYGPFLYPGAATYPDATTYPGQGDYTISRPEVQVLVAFDDLAQPASWNDVTGRVLDFSTSRGRDSELEELSAGTGRVRFNNKDGFFIPGTSSPLYPSAGTYPGSGTYPGGGSASPMNRLWIKENFNGKVRTLFYGYADSYDFTWDFMAERATVNAVDEFSRLALKALPRNDPDVESYADVVAFDEAVGYWKLADDPALEVYQGTGGSLMVAGSVTASTDGPIVGDKGGKAAYKSAVVLSTNQLRSDALSESDAGSVDGIDEFTIELWAKVTSGLPLSERNLVVGPKDAVEEQYRVSYKTNGAIRFFTRNGAAATVDINGGTVTNDGVWHHIVCTITGGSQRIYIDQAEVASSAFTAPFGSHVDGEIWRLGDTGGSGAPWRFSNVAQYRKGLPVARVQAHYAAMGRGFPLQDTDDRVNSILDIGASVSRAPRAVRAGQHQIVPTYQHGQDYLSELRQAVLAESGDSVFFHGSDSTDSAAVKGVFKLVFLDADYRSAAPWNMVTATFSDQAVSGDRSSVAYLGLERDFSQAFLFNDFTLTDGYGFASRVFDPGSIDRYGDHPRSLTIPQPTLGGSVSSSLLLKYKFPFERVTAILVDTSDASVSDVVFDLEIGDQVRVIYSPSHIDQRAYVQKIEWSAVNDGRPWTCRLGISPL